MTNINKQIPSKWLMFFGTVNQNSECVCSQSILLFQTLITLFASLLIKTSHAVEMSSNYFPILFESSICKLRLDNQFKIDDQNI